MDWIERLAREHGTGGWQTLDDMVRFGEAVAAAEREACAKICDDGEPWQDGAMFAEWIRARSNVAIEPRR